MQFNFPRPSSQFERDIVLQLTKYLSEMSNKLDRLSGSAWDGAHPILGQYHLWIDATGDLRIKSSQPTSDLDGQIIGLQS